MLYIRTAPSTGSGMMESMPVSFGKNDTTIIRIAAPNATLLLRMPVAFATPIFAVAVDCREPPAHTPTAVFALCLLLFLILGTFMETASIILLTLPILYPIVKDLGIDMVQFGVCGVISLAIGMATPPVGISLFATCPIAKITMGQISSKVWPFLLVMIAGLFLFMFFPQICVWLPNLTMGAA